MPLIPDSLEIDIDIAIGNMILEILKLTLTLKLSLRVIEIEIAIDSAFSKKLILTLPLTQKIEKIDIDIAIDNENKIN